MQTDSEAVQVEGDRLFCDDGTEIGEKLRAVLYFIHGLGEHSHRHEYLFNAFNAAGIRVHGFDLRGHGRSFLLNPSSMVQGHFGEIPLVVRDVSTLLRIDDSCDVPRFLMGHSLGAVIAISFVMNEPKATSLAGIICSAPGITPGTPVPKAKIYFGRLLKGVFPSLRLPNGVDLNNISRDKAIVESFKDDPICHTKISIQSGVSLLDTGEALLKVKECQINIPLLITQGEADVIVSPKANYDFAEKVICSDKTFKAFPDGFHSCTITPPGVNVIDY